MRLLKNFATAASALALVAATAVPSYAQSIDLSSVYELVQVRQGANGVYNAFYNGEQVAWQDTNGNNTVDAGELNISASQSQAQAQLTPCAGDCPPPAELGETQVYFGESTQSVVQEVAQQQVVQTQQVVQPQLVRYETVEVVEQVTNLVRPAAQTVTQNVTTIVSPSIVPSIPAATLPSVVAPLGGGAGAAAGGVAAAAGGTALAAAGLGSNSLLIGGIISAGLIGGAVAIVSANNSRRR